MDWGDRTMDRLDFPRFTAGHEHSPGQTLENPVTGEGFTFIHTAGSTGGELLAFDLSLSPQRRGPDPTSIRLPDRALRSPAAAWLPASAAHGTSGPGDVVEIRRRHPRFVTGEDPDARSASRCVALAMEECSPRSWRWRRPGG